MFFNLAWRNSKRSRNENLIYFLTMVTAVAAFYIVLSLGAQDVIRFLSSLESDAVERLLTNLLPTVYVCALLFVFFLVVFANKYQLECRSRELGLYLRGLSLHLSPSWVDLSAVVFYPKLSALQRHV